MRSRLFIAGGLATMVLTAVACGSSGSTASSSASPAAAATAATIAVAPNAKLGQILVDGSGRTLYLFVADKGTTSTCSGSCAQYWPPLLTSGAPKVGNGANSSLLGTTMRPDGSTQVTYGGHPLYSVVTDHNPGDATGQGVNNFGALWFVIGADGKQIS